MKSRTNATEKEGLDRATALKRGGGQSFISFDDAEARPGVENVRPVRLSQTETSHPA